MAALISSSGLFAWRALGVGFRALGLSLLLSHAAEWEASKPGKPERAILSIGDLEHFFFFFFWYVEMSIAAKPSPTQSSSVPQMAMGTFTAVPFVSLSRDSIESGVSNERPFCRMQESCRSCYTGLALVGRGWRPNRSTPSTKIQNAAGTRQSHRQPSTPSALRFLNPPWRFGEIQ